jgi:hypothetical protein
VDDAILTVVVPDTRKDEKPTLYNNEQQQNDKEAIKLLAQLD